MMPTDHLHHSALQCPALCLMPAPQLHTRFLRGEAKSRAIGLPYGRAMLGPHSTEGIGLSATLKHRDDLAETASEQPLAWDWRAVSLCHES